MSADAGVQPTRRSLRLKGAGSPAAAAAAASQGAGAATPSGSTNPSSDGALLVVPTPPANGSKKRQPPVDIGISKLIAAPALLLGGGVPAAAAADAVDHAPLGFVGFNADSLRAAGEFLREADPKLIPLIEQHCPPERLLRKTGSNFATLAKAIVFQQLATQAAAKIYGRVLAACGCSDMLTPEAVLAAPLAELRGAGLSERKASYIADLAAHFADGRLSDAKIAAMDEATLEKELCAIKGIGAWTVHMHAIFHLGSPDVVPVGDLGVRRGMQQLYRLKELPSPAKMGEIAARWRPYASLGSYLMWKVEVPRSNSKKSKREAPGGSVSGGSGGSKKAKG